MSEKIVGKTKSFFKKKLAQLRESTIAGNVTSLQYLLQVGLLFPRKERLIIWCWICIWLRGQCIKIYKTGIYSKWIMLKISLK